MGRGYYGCTAAGGCARGAGTGALGRSRSGGRVRARGAGSGVGVYGLRTSDFSSRRGSGVFTSFLARSSRALRRAEDSLVISFEATRSSFSALCPDESGAPGSAVAVVGPTSKATSSTSATIASRQKRKRATTPIIAPTVSRKKRVPRRLVRFEFGSESSGWESKEMGTGVAGGTGGIETHAHTGSRGRSGCRKSAREQDT